MALTALVSQNYKSNVKGMYFKKKILLEFKCPGDGTCSSQGTCNEMTGICICNSGFEGNTCQGN